MNTSTGNLIIATKAEFLIKDWTPAQRRNAKLVYVAIASFANNDGTAWPSYEAIADRSLLSRKNVYLALTDLIDQEYITQETRANRSNLYTWHNREHIKLDKETEDFAASVTRYKPPKRLEKEVGAGSAGPIPTRTRTILEDLLDTSWADNIGDSHD